mmetsp:Transcript_99329/g.256769  ORF Transcript_99329/g.256769 Transcript_99329/m.256769 type:complete len:247 (-) Transcript_99329:148-888(-)
MRMPDGALRGPWPWRAAAISDGGHLDAGLLLELPRVPARTRPAVLPRAQVAAQAVGSVLTATRLLLVLAGVLARVGVPHGAVRRPALLQRHLLLRGPRELHGRLHAGRRRRRRTARPRCAREAGGRLPHLRRGRPDAEPVRAPGVGRVVDAGLAGVERLGGGAAASPRGGVVRGRGRVHALDHVASELADIFAAAGGAEGRLGVRGLPAAAEAREQRLPGLPGHRVVHRLHELLVLSGPRAPTRRR